MSAPTSGEIKQEDIELAYKQIDFEVKQVLKTEVGSVDPEVRAEIKDAIDTAL